MNTNDNQYDEGKFGESCFHTKPHPLLSPHIESYAIVESPAPPTINAFGRLLPDGILKLVIHFGDQFRQRSNHHEELQERGFLHGHLPSYIEIAPTGTVGFISVNFYPQGLSSFLRMPLSQIGLHRLTTVDLWGKQGAELETKIVEAPTPQDRIRILNQFFLSQQIESSHASDIASYAAKTLWWHQGQIQVQTLAEQLGKSVRTLERIFAQQIGATPKYLCRIFRLHHLIQEFNKSPDTSLTNLAFSGGYFDQSHFISDFKKIAGVSPKSMFSSRPNSNLILLNQPLSRRLGEARPE